MRIARTRRRAIFRASAVITSAALAAGIGPAAFADSSPTATVSQILTEDNGVVEVGLGNAVPIWMQISVRASTAADAPTLFSTDDFTNDSTTAPVRLPAGTAYGDYPVDVDYRLSGGTTQHWSGGEHGANGLLNYRQHASVTGLGFDRASTDLDHRTAVLGGKVQALDPATGDTVPAPAGVRVRLQWTSETAFADRSAQSALAVTDATGSFQVPVTPGGTIEQDGTATLDTIPADMTKSSYPGYLPGLNADPTQYRISAAASSLRVHKGTEFTVSGKVQRLTSDGWKPFAGAPVVTTTTDPDSYHYTVTHQLAAATTAADGSFSYPITGNATTTVHTYLRPSPYLPPNAQDQDTVYVPTPGSVALQAYGIDEFGTVVTTGRLTGNCGNQSLWLQRSGNGRTGWSNVGHITTGYQDGSYCPVRLQTDGGWYDGYYRVVHFENNAMLGFVTPVHRARRTRTQMSIAVTPIRPAGDNSTITVTGVVTQLTSSGWAHYPHAYVVLVYRPYGYTDWFWVKKGYTNTAGRYSFSTPAYGDGTWGAYLATDSGHFYSQTKDVYVDVR